MGAAVMTKERADIGLVDEASVVALAAVTFGVTGEQRGSVSLADTQTSSRMLGWTDATRGSPRLALVHRCTRCKAPRRRHHMVIGR